MTFNVHIYIIHSERLEERNNYFKATIQKIDQLLKSNPNVGKLLINIISSPDSQKPESIGKWKDKIKLEKVNDVDFDKHLVNININMVSNILKHVEAYKSILNLTKTNKDFDNDNNLFFIMEDDIVMSNDFIGNIIEMFDFLFEKRDDAWDILFCSSSNFGNDSGKIKISSTTDQMKILHSKGAFFVKVPILQSLSKYLSSEYRYSLRIALSSFIWNNRFNINSKCFNKYLFFETSKIGFIPSSQNYSNFLSHNTEYLKMVKLSQLLAQDETKNEEYFEVFTKLYNMQEHLQSADLKHLYGIMLHKRGDNSKALEVMKEAFECLKKNHGLVHRNSEILNNLLNIYQYNQPNMDEIKKQSRILEYSVKSCLSNN
jgi:tetratricopeptide (TPR) repeat protein